MSRRWIIVGLVLWSCQGCERSEPPTVVIEQEPSVESLVATVLNGGGSFRDVEFSTLIETSTGNQVIPMSPLEETDAAILQGLSSAITAVLDRYNEPNSPTSEESRINEVSAYFEKALLEEIDAAPEFECDYPRTAEGKLQRSGYPDLLIRHLETGRVLYLDPKLVAEGSMTSSLRTFYFTPRTETNKVLHDAHHLLVGIEHDGNTGDWKFLRWHLVDLTRFKVTLKAEFQANNKDIYRPELILSEGEPELPAAESALPNEP
ncbi:MAG: hypothetical protein AAGA96_04875 [Verrucomicrobiota bacterium]